MTFEQTLFSTINALAPAGGVYANAVGEGPTVLPRIVYQRISTTPELTFAGDKPALEHIRMQIDCYDETYLGVRALATRVKDAMVAAAMARTIVNSPEGDADLYEELVREYRVTLEFFIWA